MSLPSTQSQPDRSHDLFQRLVNINRDRILIRLWRLQRFELTVQQGWGMILTPSLVQGTLCVLNARGVQLQQLRVARSSHDACFLMRR